MPVDDVLPLGVIGSTVSKNAQKRGSSPFGAANSSHATSWGLEYY